VASDTRDRIREVAQQLFIEQGYDATSLREIAERLGFTKAALYYHFQSKEQILQALLEPADGLIQEFVARLEAADGLEQWADALTWVIARMPEYMDLFLLIERNRTVLETVKAVRSAGQHQEMHDRVQRAVRSRGADLAEQVRMFAALGAVTAFDDWAPRLLIEESPEQLQPHLVAAVRDILGLPPARPARTEAAAASD
jgi:AcrR family transcriptional regulator